VSVRDLGVTGHVVAPKQDLDLFTALCVDNDHQQFHLVSHGTDLLSLP
jgi:hypothetical protein